jgi:hypothetical protein
MTDERGLAPGLRRQEQSPEGQRESAAVSVDDDYPDDEWDPDGQLGAECSTYIPRSLHIVERQLQ